MLRMLSVLVAGMALAIMACTASGPQKALDELAGAMESNDSQAFLSLIDMKQFAANHVKNMTRNDEALSSLNAIGSLLGLGSVDELINSVVDMQARLSQQFNRGVASGELMAECRAADYPACPWVPQSLRSATVVELGPDAAIAKVTTPARLTSWLAFRKISGKWLVVGNAVMEEQARAYALANSADAGQGANTPQDRGVPAKSSPKVQI